MNLQARILINAPRQPGVTRFIYYHLRQEIYYHLCFRVRPFFSSCFDANEKQRRFRFCENFWPGRGQFRTCRRLNDTHFSSDLKHSAYRRNIYEIYYTRDILLHTSGTRSPDELGRTRSLKADARFI